MLRRLRQSVARGARNAGLLLAGLACLAVGSGFFSAALWIVLRDAFGTAVAAAALGAIWSGLGLILIAARGASGRRPQPEPEPDPAHQTADLASLMNAFLGGVQAGTAARKRD